MKRLILDYIPYCTRVALVDDGELVEFSVEKTAFRGIVGNIYKGQVKNTISGMKASFVDIGLQRNGFLQMGDSLVDPNALDTFRPQNNLKVSPGDIIMCQVVKDQFGTKGARLTTDISIPGNYLVILPNTSYIGISRKIENLSRREHLEKLIKSIAPENIGFIIRSAANDADDNELINEAKILESIWNDVQYKYNKASIASVVFEESSLVDRAIRDLINEKIDEIVVNDEALKEEIEKSSVKVDVKYFEGDEDIMTHYNITDQINHICDHKVNMDNGGSIVIDRTEALTVIDVNSGKFVSDLGLADSVYKTNLAAANCIAKQVRLRNISGIIIVDFIDMFNEQHKENVVEALKNALKKDRLKTTAVGMTELGLVEFTRKKTRLPIADYLLQDCEECLTGKRFSDTQIAFMLKDELYGFIKESKTNDIYITLNPDIYQIISESNMMAKLLIGSWKDKNIYINLDDTVGHSNYIIDTQMPLSDDEFIKL